MTKMITRFAPSPTGSGLHIGGVRTALYSFLAAKHAGGEFHLRIEDTDKDRNSESSLKSIMEGLEWLGIKHDGDVVHQSERVVHHTVAAKDMITNMSAYYCYMSKAELDQEKAKADAEKRPFKYDRRWRTADGEVSELDYDGVDFTRGQDEPAIRIKMPLEGAIEFDDIVRGTLSIQVSELDDFVIMRSDGTPTYLLAVVVDDYMAGVTHVIRGEDHITNTFKQIQIYKALGWEPPIYAHLPLIHDEFGKKLSKRHEAASVLTWRDAGYLPEAVCGYLAGLGWGHTDGKMSMDEMIEKFDIHQIGSSPGRVDQKKLDNINFHFLQLKDDTELVQYILESHEKDAANLFYNQQNSHRQIDIVTKRLEAMMSELKPRAKNLIELYQSAKYLFELADYDDSAKEILSKDWEIVLAFRADKARYHTSLLKDFVEAHPEFTMKRASIAMRCALCGSKISSGSIDAIMASLGDFETNMRLTRAITTFKPEKQNAQA